MQDYGSRLPALETVDRGCLHARIAHEECSLSRALLVTCFAENMRTINTLVFEELHTLKSKIVRTNKECDIRESENAIESTVQLIDRLDTSLRSVMI